MPAIEMCHDKTVDYTTGTRPNDANFYDIPPKLLGPIRSTTYHDLAGMSDSFIFKCIALLNVQKLKGLVDSLAKIIKLQDFTVWGKLQNAYNVGTVAGASTNKAVAALLQLFPAACKTLTPGILQPMTKPSLFATIQPMTLPINIATAAAGGNGQDTWTRAAVKANIKAINTKECPLGCLINAEFTASDPDSPHINTCNIEKPLWLITVNLCPVYIKGVSTSALAITKKKFKGLAIVTVVIYADYAQGTGWTKPKIELFLVHEGTTRYPQSFRYYNVLGTVVCRKQLDLSHKSTNVFVLNIEQLKCGPVSLQDWVALEGMPSSGDIAVFYAKPNSTTKGWLCLTLCS